MKMREASDGVYLPEQVGSAPWTAWAPVLAGKPHREALFHLDS